MTNPHASPARFSPRDWLQKGEAAFDRADWPSACYCFNSGLRLAEEQEAPAYVRLFNAYLGYLALRQQHPGALQRVRAAAYFEWNQEQVFYVLALAEARCGQRLRAHSAIRQGLRVRPSHPALLALQQSLGLRKSLLFSFWPREHWLNRIFGFLRYCYRA